MASTTPLHADSGSRQRQLIQLALFAVVPVGVATLGWMRRWMSDDGFIYLRIVRNVLAGNGAVYNAGERVETATDPIWVALVSATKLVLFPLSYEYSTVVLGIAFMIAALFTAQRAGVRLWDRGDSTLFVPLGVLMVGCVAVVWDFTTGGLDTSLVLLWLAVSFGLLVRAVTSEPTGWLRWATAVWIGAGFILRPDLVPYAFAFAITGVVILGGTSWKSRLGWLAATVALPTAYVLFRMAYYGALIPAPAISKGAGTTDWEQGMIFLGDFLSTYVLIVPLVAIVAGAVWAIATRAGWLTLLRHQMIVLAMLLAAVIQVAFILRLGGGFMHGRLLIPALFVFALPLAVIPLERTWMVASLVVVGAWGLVAAVGLRAEPRNGHIADERAFYVALSGEEHPVELADPPTQQWALDGATHGTLPGTPTNPTLLLPIGEAPPNFSEGTLYAAQPITDARIYVPQSSIGMYAFAAPLDLHVIDRFGLADPIASRISIDNPERPGHSKLMSMDWIVARYSADPVAEPYVDPAKVGDAHAAIDCEAITDLLQAANADLTFGRIVHNMIGAPARTMLRIPPDPTEARSELCP